MGLGPATTHKRAETVQRLLVRTNTLARELGISPSTLRYWEVRGLIPRAERTCHGTRVWDHDKVVAAVEVSWPGRRRGTIKDNGNLHPLVLAPRGEAELPPDNERELLSKLIARAAAKAADNAVAEWLTRLGKRGERTGGVVASAAKVKERA